MEVPPERLVSWIVTFTERHGGPLAISYAEPAADRGSVTFKAADGAVAVTFTAADGAAAECHVPFPPLRAPLPSPPSRADPGEPGATGPDALAAAGAIAAHATADRTVGVLLVRLGGYAVGVFSGVPPRLGASKTGRRLVHSRSAAGGWSQHRFARRRENQAAAALGAAADAAAGIFGPYRADGLDAVILGGDKRSMAGLRDDARLAPYLSRATDRFLTVPDPSPAVLRGIPSAYLAIRIRLTELEPDSLPGAGHVQ
ncbi:MAG TPA: acVLRF1 family peptidyl-tRNA hydrolase [Streptosporangiaceae bacterium]